MFAPSSVGSRRLMMETKPICLICGTTSGLIAPEHATTVERRWKLVMPSILSLVTSWARAGITAIQAAASKPAAIRKCALMPILLDEILLAEFATDDHNTQAPLAVTPGPFTRRWPTRERCS